jgi:hypothetical protein
MDCASFFLYTAMTKRYEKVRAVLSRKILFKTRVMHGRRLSSRVSIWFAASATLLGLTNGIVADHPGEFRSPPLPRRWWAVPLGRED